MGTSTSSSLLEASLRSDGGSGAAADAARIEDLQGNEKASIPSRKNGRFSGRKVSKVVRFRITWSGSDLGEVGVERGVEGQVLGDVPLEIEAGRASVSPLPITVWPASRRRP